MQHRAAHDGTGRGSVRALSLDGRLRIATGVNAPSRRPDYQPSFANLLGTCTIPVRVPPWTAAAAAAATVLTLALPYKMVGVPISVSSPQRAPDNCKAHTHAHIRTHRACNAITKLRHSCIPTDLRPLPATAAAGHRPHSLRDLPFSPNLLSRSLQDLCPQSSRSATTTHALPRAHTSFDTALLGGAGVRCAFSNCNPRRVHETFSTDAV